MSTESKRIFFRRIQDAEAVDITSMQQFPVSKGFNGSCEVIRCTNSGEFLIIDLTSFSVIRSVAIREGHAVPLDHNVQVPLGIDVKYGTWAMIVLLQSKLNAMKVDTSKEQLKDVVRLQEVLDHVAVITNKEENGRKGSSMYEGSVHEVAD